jgi:hypothetical protein
MSDVSAAVLSPTDPNPFLADNTADDWSDKLYVFYRVVTHGVEGLARQKRERYASGRAKPTERVKYVFCDEHTDWEDRYFRISGAEALQWARDRARVRRG